MFVGVAVGVSVGVFVVVAVFVGVCVGVWVFVGVCVFVGVIVGVSVGACRTVMLPFEPVAVMVFPTLSDTDSWLSTSGYVAGVAATLIAN